MNHVHDHRSFDFALFEHNRLSIYSVDFIYLCFHISYRHSVSRSIDGMATNCEGQFMIRMAIENTFYLFM